MRLSLFAIAVLTSSLASQASQLVGPVIDASAAIRATLGFASATNFAGAIRDNAGNYWTTCIVNNQVFLMRISAAGAVTGFLSTSLTTEVTDMAYDGLRDRIWLFRSGFNTPPIVYQASTGALIGSGDSGVPAQGIAWDGAGRILIAGRSEYYDGVSMQLSQGQSGPGGTNRGLLFQPPSVSYWVTYSSPSDPLGMTRTTISESPVSIGSMVPDLSLDSGSGTRGGTAGGCEQWLSNGEWLGVFCQTWSTNAVLYTCRMGAPTGSGCGGPRFGVGPSVVQQQLYTSAYQAAGYAWLLIASAPGAVTDPLLGPGCVVHLNPALTVALGPFLPTFQGNVSGSTTIPVDPALRELPLWFQWATINFNNQVLLSEARSAAIKQF